METHLNKDKVNEFLQQFITDLNGTYTFIMGAIADRIGLFKFLADTGELNYSELATRLNINERYAQELLAGLAASKYLEFDPLTSKYSITAEKASILSRKTGFSGKFQQIPALWGIMDQLVYAIKNGGGVDIQTYDKDFWEGWERFSASKYEDLLIDKWLPLVPHIKEKLESGIAVSDFGCGSGVATIQLAREFPKSTFVGYDFLKINIDKAWSNAKLAKIKDNLTFELLDITKVTGQKFDLITVFDVIHDMDDPIEGLMGIQKSLKPGGQVFLVDIKCSDKTEENLGLFGPMLYGASITYCLTTSLSQNGAGLGTVGLTFSKLQDLCSKAGFTEVSEVKLEEDPINALYIIKN